MKNLGKLGVSVKRQLYEYMYRFIWNVYILQKYVLDWFEKRKLNNFGRSIKLLFLVVLLGILRSISEKSRNCWKFLAVCQFWSILMN